MLFSFNCVAGSVIVVAAVAGEEDEGVEEEEETWDLGSGLVVEAGSIDDEIKSEVAP